MAQRARSPPAVAGSRTTRALTRVWQSGITTCTRARMATCIATTSRRAYNRKRTRVGKQCNARLIAVGCKINNRHAGSEKCGRETSVRCVQTVVVDSEMEVDCGEDKKMLIHRLR